MGRALVRLLVIIGSGETAAKMTRVHRSIIRELVGPGGNAAQLNATVIDTPYGFQANADAISAGLVDYFTRRLGMSATVASLRRVDADPVTREAAYGQIRAAEYVFCGPGSPSYALRQWSGTPMAELLADKLASGGALVLASAAALTIGRATVPVYEIYKSGADPFWLPGLDLLARIGINAAVIPHFDNAEGTGHDTRYCFLGQRRLEALEAQLPDETFILGIDEHTALVIDVDAQHAGVQGRGAVTIRRQGRSTVFNAGEEIPWPALAAQGISARPRRTRPAVPTGAPDEASLARRVLELEEMEVGLRAWARLVKPLVEQLVGLRNQARAGGDYGTADAIRDRLAELGVALTDAADGTTSYELGGPRQP